MKAILFNTDMVKAIMEGRKTVTRRLVKPKYRADEVSWNIITEAKSGEFVRIEYWDEYEEMTRCMPQPFYAGDILYVRETWRVRNAVGDYDRGTKAAEIEYKAEGETTLIFPTNPEFDKWRTGAKWHPSLHMPKEAARIFLRVVDVRVERLKSISASHAMSEGVNDWNEFIALWNRTIKPADRSAYGWDANPWVWVIEFERCNKEAAG